MTILSEPEISLAPNILKINDFVGDVSPSFVIPTKEMEQGGMQEDQDVLASSFDNESV